MKEAGSRKPADLLSFRATGWSIAPGELTAEFCEMMQALKHLPGLDVLRRVGASSGSHLLKLVSARVDGSGGRAVVLRSDKAEGSRPRPLLPSLNAPDIPAAKLVYRPLEIAGGEPRALVEHLREADTFSARVEEAFALAYGRRWLEIYAADTADTARMRAEIVAECSDLDELIGVQWSDALARKIGLLAVAALRKALTTKLELVRGLPAREFPIIFLPRPGGGDLQVTPLSPAAAFGDMDDVRNRHFLERKNAEPGLARGYWVRQHVSAKPQNISGAIGKSRNRFFARLPPPLKQSESELYHFVHGGRFPPWRQPDLDVWLFRYGDVLAKSSELTTVRELRLACDRLADRLIADAEDFAAETLAAAQDYAAAIGLPGGGLHAPSVPAIIASWRRWGKEDKVRCVQILTSEHFRRRLARRTGRGSD